MSGPSDERSRPRLELDRVEKRFGGLTALRGVTLRIEPGSLVVLIGPNGAGKTTLFDVITGLERPTRGAVAFDGIDLTLLAPHRIARLGITRTFQIGCLFPRLSAVENVLVGVTFGRHRREAPGEPNRRAEHLLEVVGLREKASVPARELSLGEQKRLELAMALGPEPRLLLADELTSGLSPRGRREVVRYYRRLRERGLTVFAIEHSFEAFTELADRVLVLDQGEIVADGRPRDVLASPRVIEAYLGEEDAE